MLTQHMNGQGAQDSLLAKHTTNDRADSSFLCNSSLTASFCARHRKSPTPLPLSLSVPLYLALPCSNCALPKQITLYLCEGALQTQSCRCVEAYCFKMRKESKLIRWIGWILVVTAVLLLGFIVGKT